MIEHATSQAAAGWRDVVATQKSSAADDSEDPQRVHETSQPNEVAAAVNDRHFSGFPSFVPLGVRLAERAWTLLLIPMASASRPIEIPPVPSTVARRTIVGLKYARTIVLIRIQEEPSMSIFPPIAHVALTVRDLEVSVPWYTALFEDEPVLDEETGPFRHVVWMVSGTLVGLHQFPDSDVTTPFSERRAGLDHVAFGVADRSELEIWEKRLDQLGVSHDTIKDAGYGSGLSFRDPDGLPLEFFAPPA
ncbi:VOC family protein [Cryobacterium frigoriphilum]|nr:VOC family protein [Cryobacterium frigoriphilum]